MKVWINKNAGIKNHFETCSVAAPLLQKVSVCVTEHHIWCSRRSPSEKPCSLKKNSDEVTPLRWPRWSLKWFTPTQKPPIQMLLWRRALARLELIRCSDSLRDRVCLPQRFRFWLCFFTIRSSAHITPPIPSHSIANGGPTGVLQHFSPALT